jgi:chemotaxis protein MotB
MSRRRIKNQESSGGGSPGWMTTFSDLMSLLLTFFILLYSMSTVDAQKFRNITYSLQQALTGMGGTSILEGEISNEMIPIDESREIGNEIAGELISNEILIMYEKVSNYLQENNLEANVAVKMNTQGVFVNINEAILFDLGSAKLKDSGIELLKRLEGLVNDFDNDIVIEGHTDNIPINGNIYPTNWELSTARAVSVVRYLSEVERIDPSRLSARGYGEYSPIAPNDTQENRALNRRVNMFIVFDKEGVK